MYSLRAARTALDVVGLLDALGAPLLARAPETLLRPDEEEDDRREDREIHGGAKPVLLVGVRRVLVDDEPLVRALGNVRPRSRVPRNCVRFALRSARAFVESSESIDPALFLAMLAVFTEREA